MFSVIFGLSAALSFGATDFLGGIASRYIGSLRTVWLTVSTSLIFVLLGTLFLPTVWSNDAIVFGALSGVSSVLALVFLFASLAIGPMSILSPVGAVVGALLPTLWDIFSGKPLSWFAYLAIAFVLIAGVLVGLSKEKDATKPKLRGLIFAVAAGFLFALYYVLLDQAPNDAGLAPLVANRVSSTLVATIGVAAILMYTSRVHRGKPGVARADIAVGEGGTLNWRKGLPIAVTAGAFEAIGTTFVIFGLGQGNLTIIAVLTSLYPAGTILLATIFLKERIGKIQYLGLFLALSASVTLAFA